MQRDCVSVLVGQREVGGLLPNPRGLRRKRDLLQHIENFITEETKQHQSDHGENRAEDLATIELRSTERAKKADKQKRGADAEEQKIRPREIPRDRKLREPFVAE